MCAAPAVRLYQLFLLSLMWLSRHALCSETTEWTFVLVHFMTDMTKVKRGRGRGRRKGQNSKGRRGRGKGKGIYIVASRHLCVGNIDTVLNQHVCFGPTFAHAGVTE